MRSPSTASVGACGCLAAVAGLVLLAGCGNPIASPVIAATEEAKPVATTVAAAPEPVASEAGAARPQAPDTNAPPASDQLAAAEPEAKPAEKKPAEAAEADENPFPRRLEIPDFPKDMEWINSRPLSKRDLKGKFVILDFWTYCCINCMHILPELKKLEHKYPNELVVIGVHSAKFDTEKDSENILGAVLRYEIEHPVVNDHEHQIWQSFGVNSWPTALMIDPEGNAVWGRSGEFKADEVAKVLELGLPYYRKKGLLNEKPIAFELEASKQAKTPLRFPGKVLADEAGKRLFITDSNHNRIVIAGLDGKPQEIIGSGQIGRADGPIATATFDHPQGCALLGDTLYVADTENHLLRKVDLKAKTVSTIAGIGEQGKSAWPGLENLQRGEPLPERWVGPCKSTALNSPWDLWVHKDALYIAMAGPHQIWRMPLDESEIGPFAGNGREDIVDGPLLPVEPYELGYSSFAQPSGLSSDGEWLFVADSEGSSIRAVPFDRRKEVRTVIGSNLEPQGRLFDFGDIDGPREKAKLQHALAVVYDNGKLYVADTYNNKLKEVDAKTGAAKTLAGDGKPGASDEGVGQFDEPAGLALAAGKLYIADTNNHLIRTFELSTGKVGTFVIAGLTPPGPPTAKPADKKPAFKSAEQEKAPLATLKPAGGKVQVKVVLEIPLGWKINQLAPMSYWVDSPRETGPIDRAAFGKRKLEPPAAEFTVELPAAATGEDEIAVSLNYAYCQDGDSGVCKFGAVVITIPVKLAEGGAASSVTVKHTVRE